MKTRHWLCLVVAVAGAFLAKPAHAQMTAEIIRGRVIGPDSLPIPNVIVSVLSFQGGITKETRTDKNGRFSVVYPNGEGDYWVSFNAVGFVARRFEVKRQADEAILIADTKMSKAAAELQRVEVVTQGAKQPPPRTSNATDIGGTEKFLGGAVSADQLGNLAAMASAIPGIQLIPGVDGNPDMFSALGLDPSQNSTTLNGIPSNLLGIPPDGGIQGSLRLGGGDISNGGFSGGSINLNVPSGSNYTSRGLRGMFNSPQTQLTDNIGQSSASTLLSLSGNGSGPITMDKSFYYGSYSVRRTMSDEQDLFNTARDVLQNAGVSRDSAQRLNSVLQTLGIPRSVGGIPGSRMQDNASLIGAIDLAPKAATSGASYKITGTMSYSGLSPLSNSMYSTPSFLGKNRFLNGSLQARHTDYFGSGFFAGTLTQTSVAATLSSTNSDPYLQLPGGTVRVLSALDDSTQTAQFLRFGGNSSLRSSSNTKSFIFQNALQWVAPNNKHTIKLASQLVDDITTSTTPASLGSFSYQSLADLEAGAPSSYTRRLNAVDNVAKGLTGYVGLQDSWIPKPGIFQMQYGVRLDGNYYYDGPQENPAVQQAFGVKNNYVPNKMYASPRLGFTWTYGQATQIPLAEGFAFGPRARVQGSLSMNQQVSGASLIQNARANTGLPGSTVTLSCIGPATPVPDWDAYLANPESAPSQCADGTGGTVFASTLPRIVMFDPNYKQSKSFNASLLWAGAILDNRFNASFGGTYSFQLNQPGTIDLNFNPTQQFALDNESNRPVYAKTSSIVPTTGLIASRDARVSQDFGTVSMNKSNLRAEARQLTVSISPLNFQQVKFTWGLQYAYLNRVDKYNGFSSTTGNPLDLAWGTSAGPDHDIRYNLSYYIANAVRISYSGALQSGHRYTPMILGDVNGDGSSNDRAFIFDPAHSPDSAVSSGMQALLASGSSQVRDCLQSQIGKLGTRNSCSTPWSLVGQSLSVSFTPGHVWMPPRTTITLSVSNPLGAADVLINGNNKLKGWGQVPNPDRSLLYVRGFDPVSQRYTYEVNKRFGSTDLSNTTQRTPAVVTLSVSYDMAPPRDWQNFRTTIDRGRNGRPGTKIPESSLRSYSTNLVVNPMARILQTADALKLSRLQADSIAKLSRGYTLFVDSLWAPIAKYMGALPDKYDRSVAEAKFVDARIQAIDYLIKVVPKVSALLTKGQKRAMSVAVSQYLDPTYLQYLRTGVGSQIFFGF